MMGRGGREGGKDEGEEGRKGNMREEEEEWRRRIMGWRGGR